MKKSKDHKIRPVHPFAARMAPEIALNALLKLPVGSIVLDPMAGSGTVLRTISELGFHGIGFDIDPLAVLMSKAWTTKMNEKNFLLRAEKILSKAGKLKAKSIKLPWIDNDKPTKDFIKFWFAQKQITQLRKLSYLLNKEAGVYSSLLKIAFSRLIITKSKGASLAADISHSRPHKVKDENDFDVMIEFKLSCARVAKLMAEKKAEGKVNVRLGDARKLSRVKDNSIDFIITSPPYLNALDYMRGHKLSLVWLGYKIGVLGGIRSKSVGVEKAPDVKSDIELAKIVTRGMKSLEGLQERKRKMIYRYALDMYSIVNESHRVLQKGGKAILVVGNSCINEIFVENTLIIRNSAKMAGLKLINQKEREIPQTKRYLPAPTYEAGSSLKKRMRTEAIMTFSKPN